MLKGWVTAGGNERASFVWQLVISLGKLGIWEARTVLLKSGVDLGPGGVYRRIKWDLMGRMRRDVTHLGYHTAKERWKGLFLV